MIPWAWLIPIFFLGTVGGLALLALLGDRHRCDYCEVRKRYGPALLLYKTRGRIHLLKFDKVLVAGEAQAESERSESEARAVLGEIEAELTEQMGEAVPAEARGGG